MTSQINGSGKLKREAAVCIMESKKDDSPLTLGCRFQRRALATKKNEGKKIEKSNRILLDRKCETVKRYVSELPVLGNWTLTVAQYASCRPIECAKQRISICFAVACVLLLLFICKPTAPFLQLSTY
jgi:hypothetical protein